MLDFLSWEHYTMKRLPIKWVRDRAKAAYEKKGSCEICGTTEELEFHHYYTMTPLFNKWCKSQRIIINSDQDVLDCRDAFIEAHRDEIYNQTVTLCKSHHAMLHKVYGKDPNLGTAIKQKAWVQIQREKLNGNDIVASK